MDQHHDDPQADEHVEDLDVPEDESEDVKGGLLPYNQQLGSKLGQKFDKHSPIGQKVDPGLGRLGDGSV